VFNTRSLKIGLGILNCVVGTKCFILDVMQLLALLVSNLACTVTHNINASHISFEAIRTHCVILSASVFTHTVWHYSNLYRYSFIVYCILQLRYSYVLYHILHTRLLFEYTHCITFYVHMLCCILCTQIVSHFQVCCRAECCFLILLGLCAHETRYTVEVANFLCSVGLREAKGENSERRYSVSRMTLAVVRSSARSTQSVLKHVPLFVQDPQYHACLFGISHFDVEHFVFWGRFGAL
jgi:hypothetical protein